MDMNAARRALYGMKDMEEGDDEYMVNPESESPDADVLYLKKDLFDGKCKVGEKVLIEGEVVSLGSKYGIQPSTVKKSSEDGEETDKGATEAE